MTAITHNNSKRALAAALGALLVLPTAQAAPSTQAPPKADPVSLDLKIQKARLENGLRVVLNVDRSSPNVGIAVTYDVGARNEQVGRSGFAHLFEHMMFQGSKNVPKGGHFTLITARGGSLNGTTSSDRTNYFEVLPSNELALGLWLEADRMKSLDVSEENLQNQRAVVQEEYRMRVSNSAYSEGYMKLNELAFEGYFPYSHDAIGSMKDLDAAEFAWVKSFHDQYYAPNNAVLSIAGDFDPDQAMQLVRDYFGPAKSQPSVPVHSPPELPAQTERREVEVSDANAKTPGGYYGWTIPPNRTRDHYALEMAAILLGDGESSRLHRRLVRELGKARSAEAWTSDHRGPDLLAVQVLLTERSTFPEVERVLTEEVRSLATRGPTPEEMRKAHNRITSHFVFNIQSNLSRATQLGTFELFYGDARLLNREVNLYLSVTGDDVKRAVAEYLTPNRLSVVHVVPTNASNSEKGKP